MAKKILNTLTNNLGYKILAIVLACILWLVVYNLDDPNKTKTFTTNVSILNGEAVTNMNKCYEVIEGTNTVTFRVTAKRSYLDKLEDTNFTAVADMNNLVIDEEQQTATVPIKISSNVYSKYISISGGAKYLKISLEDLMSKRFTVVANTGGKVADGCALGEVTISNPTVIKVSGPVSIVSAIDKIVATIDVDGMSTALSDNVVPVLYDEDGKEIDTTRLTLSNSIVTISAKILPIKEVNLNFHVKGTPRAGYDVTGITSKPDKITIKGSASVLNPLTSIDIPEDVLNVEGANENIETTIDVTEYLPEGVELADSSQRIITVIVTIEGYTAKQITIPSENIEILGISSGLEAQFGQMNIVVSATGRASALQELRGEDMIGKVDVSGMGEGTHSVLLQIDTSDDYKIAEKYVEVVLTKKTSDVTDNNTSDNTAGNTATDNNTPGDEGGSEGDTPQTNQGEGESETSENSEENTN